MVQYVSGVCYISEKTNWTMQLFNLHVIHINITRVRLANGSHFFRTIIARTSTSGLWR